MGRGNNNGNRGSGRLFYAVILAEQECDFGSIGLDGQRVHSLHYRDVGALVSNYPRVDSIKLLRKNLASYYCVTRKAAEHFTTIPARFGQVARDAGEVSLALRRNHGQIRQELGRLDGKVEMGLKAWWDVENLFEYFLERDGTLKARRDQLIMARGDSLSRMAQVEFGGYVFERMQQARRKITERILVALPPGEARVEDIYEDRLITNATLLIRKDLQKPLEEAVDALAESMGDEYRLNLDGPWPPFSFVDRLELHFSYS